MPIPKPQNEAKRIDALRRYRILDTPAEQSFDDIALIAATVCGTPIALMTLLDGERQWFKARVGLDVSQTPREHAFCSYTILGGDVLVVEDALKDVRFSKNPLVTSNPHIRFYAGSPLVDSRGYALGSLCVIDHQPRVLAVEQLAVLQALSRQVISLIEFLRVSAELAEALTEIETLQGFLPICMHCKKVRNDKDYWESVEHYISQRSAVRFSHGICPHCVQTHYPEVYAQMQAKRDT